MKDEVIKPYNLKIFQNEFTNSTIIMLATSEHFPQEEEPEKLINAILDFLKEKNTTDFLTDSLKSECLLPTKKTENHNYDLYQTVLNASLVLRNHLLFIN